MSVKLITINHTQTIFTLSFEKKKELCEKISAVTEELLAANPALKGSPPLAFSLTLTPLPSRFLTFFTEERYMQSMELLSSEITTYAPLLQASPTFTQMSEFPPTEEHFDLRSSDQLLVDIKDLLSSTSKKLTRTNPLDVSLDARGLRPPHKVSSPSPPTPNRFHSHSIPSALFHLPHLPLPFSFPHR